MSDRARWWSRVRWVLIVLACLYGLYLVVGNVLLNGVGQKLAASSAKKTQVSWAGGWTLWPGQVHVRGLDVRGQSRRITWQFELEKAILEHALVPLFGKGAVISEAAGHGLTFRLDRLDEPVDRPRRPPRPNPWTLELLGIEIDEVHEIEIEDQIYRGEGRVRGEVEVVIGGEMTLGPTTLELLGGQITSGDEVVSEDATLIVEVSSEPFSPRENKGRQALKFFAGRVRFESERTSFGFIDAYFARAPWIQLGGMGVVAVDAMVEGGRILPGSTVRVTGRELTVDALDLVAQGAGEIHAEVSALVEPTEVAPTAESATLISPDTLLTLRLDDFVIDRVGPRRAQGEPLVRGTGLELVAEGSQADLVEGFGDLRAEVTVPRSDVPDLASFDVYLPSSSDLRIHSGSGSFAGRVAFDSASQTGDGELEIQGQDVGLRFDDFDLIGDLKLMANLPHADLAEQRWDLSGTRLELDRYRVAHTASGTEETGWWGRVTVQHGDLRTGEASILDASIKARIRDSGPLTVYIADRRPLSSWIRKLLTIEDVNASGRLWAGPEILTLDDIRITGEHLEVLGACMQLAKGRRDGLFFLSLRPFSAAVESQGGERDWKLRRSRRWYESRAVESPVTKSCTSKIPTAASSSPSG